MDILMRTAIATFSYLVVLGIALPTVATTWYVEQDGSGDFTVIQHAVNAASAGDTIISSYSTRTGTERRYSKICTLSASRLSIPTNVNRWILPNLKKLRDTGYL